ncbi:E3 ubiquitin-protein ligase LRSAM1-like isoform X1 [Neodiprion virginianus]|uniref:E3 ubiquitin-protein ligase LRSAM1-like isoform X1 n=1 Tax=Neodiprion virginianus TaxID=2961670 RepID=UPI001EE75CE4|nr:E3 ubiquitin-protein ligase LRSAM1-like isoform X1 [Neodiprion virginianus]
MFFCCFHIESIMSNLGKYGNKVQVDYKARLEHKLYLARENPEPVFDISECALKNVPSGIYSLCKVFRKKVLWMQCNKLSSLSGGGALSDLSLLTVLDLHDNCFTFLPSDIAYLTSLKELYLQNNTIRKLPIEILNLTNLSVLNVAQNNLKYLPEPMGELRRLTVLDISHNKHLDKLPKSLGYSQLLSEIKIEGLKLSYPPQDVISGGVVVIVAFLAKESGVEYTPENCIQTTNTSRNSSSENRQMSYQNVDNDIQATLMKLEKNKACFYVEHRQHALLEVEKNIREQQKYEHELQSSIKAHREKLLEDLALQQTQLEQEIEKVQQERDNDRARLLSYIYNAEKEADNVIKEFLHHSEEERQSQAELLEKEKLEEVQLLAASHSAQFNLRTKDTLSAMEELLGQELLTEQKLEEYTKFRDYTAQSLLGLEVRNNDHLTQIVQDQERTRQDLVISLRKDEALQKAAVTALLERSDTRSWSIVQQVNLVQAQLANLTAIELEKRKLETNQQINDIADKRVTLSIILMDLLQQQENRRQQLIETINQIAQQQHTDSSRRGSQFWLMQYQSLMETRPQGLLETLEPMLVRHLAIAGVMHCLPFLSTIQSLLPHITHEDLIEVGIKSANDRTAIILATENYLAEKKLHASEHLHEIPSVVPSAPEDKVGTSSKMDKNEDSQGINSTECVICLDMACQVIFLPCGHMCCCTECANKVATECPMCRSVVERRIRVLTT